MLEYVALGFLIFMAVSLLFGAVAIVGIPHGIAVERNHPHQDAIYFAGWVSLFTLHLAWPLLWIWAAAYRQDDGPKFVEVDEDTAINDKAPDHKESTDKDSNVKQEKGSKVMQDKPRMRAGGREVDADITDSVTLLGHRFEVLKERIERIEKAIMAASKAA